MLADLAQQRQASTELLEEVEDRCGAVMRRRVVRRAGEASVAVAVPDTRRGAPAASAGPAALAEASGISQNSRTTP